MHNYREEHPLTKKQVADRRMRRTALLLALLMLLSVFTACGSGGAEEEKKGGANKITAVDESIAHMEALDFNDQEIVVAVSEYLNTEITLSSIPYIEGPKRIGSDSVLNEIYQRNDMVQNTLNLYTRYVYLNIDYSAIEGDVKSKVNNGGPDVPDLYIDQVCGLIRSQMAGHLMNVRNDQFTSHFDFGDKTKNDKGWYNPYMSVFNFASDEKMYLLASDYFMDVIRFLTLIGVNLTDFQSLFMSEGGTQYLYDTVEAGKWTTDRLITWAERAYKDTGSKKGAADPQDELGLSWHAGGSCSQSMLATAGVSHYTISADGTTWTVASKQHDYNAIESWIKVLRANGVHVQPSGYDIFLGYFVNGNVLFSGGIQLFHLETNEFKNMGDNKCVIPYPKAIASDDYVVTTHNNARVGAILISSKKFEEVSAWVQASTLASQEVLDMYYNEAMKYKYGTEYGTTLMLDIIYEHIGAPYWIIDMRINSITNTGDMTANPTNWRVVTESNGTNMYTSKYASTSQVMTEAMRIYRNTFDKLK